MIDIMVAVPAENDPLSRWLTGEGQKTLDLIMGGALDVIGVVDPTLTLRYVNWTVPGLTREGIVGKSVLDLVPPGYKDVARDTYTEVLRTGVGTRFETIYADGDNMLVWDVRVGAIRFEGEIIGLIMITNDVTEQRREHADRDRFFLLSLDLQTGQPGLR
jgi:PAS domain S-box-containing protein